MRFPSPRVRYSLIKSPRLQEFAEITRWLNNLAPELREPFGGFSEHLTEEQLHKLAEFAKYVLNNEEVTRYAFRISGVDLSRLDLYQSILEIRNPDNFHQTISFYWHSQILKYEAMRKQLTKGLQQCAQSTRMPVRIARWNQQMIESLNNEMLMIISRPHAQHRDIVACYQPDTLKELPELARRMLPYIADQYVNYSYKRQIYKQANLFPNIILMQQKRGGLSYNNLTEYRKPERECMSEPGL